MGKINIDIVYDKTKKTRGYILDITSSGVGLITSKNIPANTAIVIIPKSAHLVKLKGKVVYTLKLEEPSHGYRSGVKFIAPSKKQVKSLQDLIEKMNKREFLRLGLI